jgi:hypothetical protein
MATACGFWWRAASVVWEAKLQKQKSCNLLLNWDFISILNLMIDCICQFVTVHCCFKNVDYNFCCLDGENYNIQSMRWTLNIVMLSFWRSTLNIHQLWIWLLLFGLWTLNMSMWWLDNCIDMMLPECMFVITRWKHQLEWKHDKHYTCYRFANCFFLACLQNGKVYK